MARETELFVIVAMGVDRKKGEAAAEIDISIVEAGREQAQEAAAQIAAKIYPDATDTYAFVKRMDKNRLLQMLIEDKRQSEGK